MDASATARSLQHQEPALPIPRRLVLLLDGTWNKREDTTNVWRMRMMLREDQNQLVYYDEGVGTEKGEIFTGGALGSGLSAKVLRAYLWLMEKYEVAEESDCGRTDEIYVFGFSRGAFTARSLVGFLAIAGLLNRDAPTRILDAFELSRLEGLNEHSPLAANFRARFSRSIRVKFLGVWDTVGALGIPRVKGFPQLTLKPLEANAWHKVRGLPSIVDHARHAMALDEHRYIFDATLWPDGKAAVSMEQRWFIGAHANVGGGYGDDGLFRRPLQWLQDESAQHGLDFRQRVRCLGDSFYASAPRDPLDEVGYGAYNLTQWLRPHNRRVTLGDSSNQCIDFTVLERWVWNPWYVPSPLAELLPSKPKRRPQRMTLSDAEIQDFLERPTSSSFSARGFVAI